MLIYDGSLVAKLYPTLVTPGTVACQAPLSMGFSRQEYWSGLPFPSPGDLPTQESNPASRMAQWVKNPLAMEETQADATSITRSGRFPGGGRGNPLQYSWLENPRGQRSLVGYSLQGWKSWTGLKWLSLHTHIHSYKKCITPCILIHY